MSHIQNLIGNKCIVNITNRYLHITSLFCLCTVIGQRRSQIGKDDSGKLFFQEIISCLLQIGINRKIDIISCFCLFPLLRLNDLSHTVNIKFDFTFFTLKCFIQCLLQPCFSNHIRKRIRVRLLFIQRIIFIL